MLMQAQPVYVGRGLLVVLFRMICGATLARPMGVEPTFNRMHRPMNYRKLLLLSLLALTVAIGCKEAQPTETAPAPAPENASTPAAAPPVNGNSLPPANQAAPSQVPAAPTIDTTKGFAEVNTALKA